MPVQTPQWTEVLSCPICCKDFSPAGRQPVSLSCGHTACRMCLSKLHRQQCPFDQTAISKDVDKLPTNYAILQLLAGPEVMLDPSRDRIPDGMKPADFEIYQSTQRVIEELAIHLKPLGKSTVSSTSGSQTNSLQSSGSGNQLLSRPIQRKLVTLVNCQLVEEEGRARAVRAARSLGERIVTELIIQHQNPQQLSANLWAAVRARGCQFLGPAMQEETLKLVLLALEDGTPLSRKVLVMFVVQKLEQQFPQASKTSVGHVVQLLYRASCFKVTKREEESSLMQLKEEFRNYESLRREHDAQIVQIAIEAGLRISPEQWSSLLYGDLGHKSHMQSIIDKLQTPASFASSIQELTICLQRSGDPVRLAQLHGHLERLAAIDPSPGAMSSSWEKIKSAVDAVKKVLKGLLDFMLNYSQNKKALDLQTQNIKYKTSLCRDVQQKGGCPRGTSCTFAHSEEELEKYRSKSRQLLSMLNNQAKNQKNPRGDENTQDLTQHSFGGMMGSDMDYVSSAGDFTLSWGGRGVPSLSSSSNTEGRTTSVPVTRAETRQVQRRSPEGESHDQEAMTDDLGNSIQVSLLGLSEALEIGDGPKTSDGGAMRNAPSGDPPARSKRALSGSASTPTPIASGNAHLYLANRSMSRNDREPVPTAEREGSLREGGGGGRLPPSREHYPHVQLAKDVPRREGRYSVPGEEEYYYDRRMPPNLPAQRPAPSDAPREYKPTNQPTPPLQPRILISTNPPPTPTDPYLERAKPPKHAYPYIEPVGGRYLYPDPHAAPIPPPQRQSVYRRPPVQRYVDPHTMQAYDVVPADDYAEPSAPPPSLVSGRDYHLLQHQGEPMERYREPQLYQDYYTRVRPKVPLGPPAGSAMLIPPPQDLPDEAPVADLPKKKVKAPAPPVVAPSMPKHPTKVERGPSLTELKERQDYLICMLGEIQEEGTSSTKDWKAVSKPSSSWPVNSGETITNPSSSSSSLPATSIWTSSSSNSTPRTRGNLSFIDDDDDDDDDNDHRNNGIDVDDDDEDDLLSKPVRESDDENDDDSEMLGGQDERTNSEISQGSYNPWTSTALFTPNTGKAKETQTNYTMTYSKVLVRHMSANENDDLEQTRSMGMHDMHDFEAMSLTDLQQTFNKVKQQDQRAGSSHHERTSKIQLEMVRRQDDVTAPGLVPSSPISSNALAPLPAQLVTKKPILHLYTKVREEPPPPSQPRGKGGRQLMYEPASRTARSMGRNTGPLKVSAGMIDNTMPVNMTVQDCQVAPGFQTPDGEGYYIRTAEGEHSDTLDSIARLPQDDWESKVDQLVECDPQAEQKLKQALDKVRTHIQAKETAKDAHNTFILNFEQRALENMASIEDARLGEHKHGGPITVHADSHSGMIMSQSAASKPESRAVKMQETVLSRYARQSSLPPGAGQPLPTSHPSHQTPESATYVSPWSWGSSTGGSGGSGAGGGGGGGSWPEYPSDPYQNPVVSTSLRMQPMQQGMYTHDRARRHGNNTDLMSLQANDRRIAEMVQKEEQEEYLRQLQRVQQRKQLEQQRRLQEEMDRRKAHDIAMMEAMARGYSYQ